MSGTWAVVWPSGKPYAFYRTIDGAQRAADHASRLQRAYMRVVLWR